MVAPIRLRSKEILRKARETLIRGRYDAMLQRQTRLAWIRVFHSFRAACLLTEQTNLAMSEVVQKRWRERRRALEAELKKMMIAGLGA
jgi:hypothetical protein